VGRVKRRGAGHEREGGVAVIACILVVLVMAMGAWVAAYAGATGKVPRGTTILGVAVGGHDRFRAADVLADGVARELTQPMTVTVGSVTTEVTPEQAGLSVDYVASVSKALGPRSWDPRRLWGYYTGGSSVAPVVDVDQGKLDALLTQLDQTAGQPVRDGAISFTGGQLSVTQPQQGAQVDHAQAEQTLVAAWSQGRRDVTLPLQLTAPAVGQDALDQAVAQVGNPALSGPVTLTFGAKQVTLAPQQYADLLSFAPADGGLALQVDADGLKALVHPGRKSTEPTDATVAFANGAPTVVPAVDGQTYDASATATALLQAVVGSGAARTVAVPGTAVPAAVSTDDATGLGIGEVVSTFSVPAAGPGLATGATRLTGTVIRPGDTFSFDQVVGDLGDPASADRLATATWNAGFLAGLTDVARTAPASYTDPSVPMGRDVSVGVGDLQLRNDTPHGVLLSAHVDGASITVDVWSTKTYDVTATAGAPYNVVPRATRTDATPGCVGAAGGDGFSVDLSRTVTGLDGSPVRSDTVTTTYQPSDAVVCAPPAA
jgi:vancomycin resistance protein YoaR